MNENEDMVYSCLLENAVGKSNSKTSDEINQLLENRFIGRTNEPLRLIIDRLIKMHGKVIGSYKKGYFIINSEDELQEVENSLEKRIAGIEERRNKLRENWENL